MPKPPSNPGWKYGYVPSPGEWNNTFAGKVDYPAPVEQGGTGAFDSYSANYNLAQRQEVITPTVEAAALTFYSLRTDDTAIVVQLPLATSCKPGDWIILFDAGANARANNITVTASGSDEISHNGTLASSLLIQSNGAQCVLSLGNDGAWHAQVIGQSTGIGFAAAGIRPVTASITLDPSYFGYLCKITGTAVAVTLPSTGAIEGNTIALDNANPTITGQPISISALSGDFPTTLNPGDCCILVADGAGGWWRAAYYTAGSGSQVQPAPTQVSDTEYTLTARDAGQYIQFTSNSPVTVTIPTNLEVPFTPGTVIVFEQYGTGTVTLTAESGVTLNSHNGLHSGGQYAVFQMKNGSNGSSDTWTVLGDTTP